MLDPGRAMASPTEGAIAGHAMATVPPPARRRDAQRSKAAILEAAKVAFSTRGYATAGIREIAADAAINPALVLRYFGSKELLFERALTEELTLDELIGPDRATLGRHLVTRLLDRGGRKVSATAMLVMAAADPRARAIALRLLETQIVRPLCGEIDGSDAEGRAVLVTAICTGIITYRELLPLRPLAEEDEPTIARAAALLQSLLAPADGA
jgi:AcrR family transcriptional regulator